MMKTKVFFFSGHKMGEAKRWCFTINNPTQEDIQLLVGTEADGPQAKLQECQYLIFQEERGENGTLHWQGFLILKKKKRLTWLKRNINPRAHWEIARGTNEQARDYCRKDDTYTGGIRHEYGSLPEKPVVKKKDERLQDAIEELDIIKEGYKRPCEIPSMTLMQCGFIPAMKELTADILGPYRPKLRVVTMIGPPASGKSYAIQMHCPEHGRCIAGNNGVWFQNPTSKVMLFEEFCGQIPLQKMLQLLDPYPNALEVKGGMRPAMYEIAIITSNTPPHLWYTGAEPDAASKRRDALEALWDRIGYSFGGYQPKRTTGTYLEAPFGWNTDQCRTFFDTRLFEVIHSFEHISDEEPEVFATQSLPSSP